MKRNYIIATSALAYALAVPGGIAHAQVAQDEVATDGEASVDGQLEEIVVTAQRRAENLQRAAVAVSVVGADALANGNVTQSSQLTTLVPALQVSSSGATNLFYLRGVGTFAVNAFSDPAIAFNYDGVYVGRPSATTGVFYDVERVEVLKGPQGTLYGRNATGGAINILPAKPRIGETSGNFSATVGNYDTITLQGGANFGVSDTSAIRLAGVFSKHDGYLSDGTSDEDGKGARIQFLVEPTTDLTIRIGADYFENGGLGGGAALAAIRDPFTGNITPSPLGRDVGVFDPRVEEILTSQYNFQVGRTLGPLQPEPGTDSKFWGANAEVNLTTNFGTFTFVPAYRKAHLKARNGVTTFFSDFDEETDQYSAELRFASPSDGPLQYLLGGYYYREESDVRDSFHQQALTNFITGILETRSAAAFGRLTWNISDTLRLTGGLRYTDDRKTIDGNANTFINICLAPACPDGLLLSYAPTADEMIATNGLIGPFPSPNPAFGSVFISPAPTAANNIVGRNIAVVDAVQSTSKLTYRLGAEFDAGPNSLIYASYETGYRGGGFSFAADVSKQQYQPETIKAFTLGSKNRFMGNRLQINAEAFYWKYEDQQVAHFGVDTTGASAFFTENIGNSRNFGGEIESQFLATPTTLLSANIQYLDAKYTDFTYITPAPPPTRCAVIPGSPSTVDCSGLTALRAPRWTMNFGLRQTVPLGSYQVVFDGSARYQSGSYIGFELLDAQRQESYWTGSVSAAFGPENEDWAITAFVNNIGDQRPWGNNIYNNIANLFAAAPGAPRLYGLRLSVKY